jgi:hypothetical protein
MPLPAMHHPTIAPTTPVERANAAGRVKMPAPIIEPTTSATRALRESCVRGALTTVARKSSVRCQQPAEQRRKREQSEGRGRPAPNPLIGLLERDAHRHRGASCRTARGVAPRGEQGPP